jgi:tRNA threonylcarbamoyladenosine biosynthesis protein TsaE
MQAVLLSATMTLNGVKLDNLPDMVDTILQYAGDCRIILLNGELGAGKTTLVNVICQKLEVEDKVSSPTFSIINEYYSKKNGTIYHFDCYRLKSEEEALDIGIEEYFYSGGYCLIEWSEKIANLIPEQHIRVNISVLNQDTRTIELNKE